MDLCRTEGEKNVTHSLSTAKSVQGEPAPPEAFVEQLNQLGPVAAGDVLTGGHGHQAGAEDGGGHEAQLGRLEITQERPKPGHLLGAQRGYVGLLQARQRYSAELTNKTSLGI